MAKKKFITATREDLGECLHTALRKYCDSTPTSIAWNAIYLLKPETWAEYLDIVWKRLENPAIQNENHVATLLWRASVQDWSIMADNAGVILSCAFRLFKKADWQGYASLLYDMFTK